MPRFKSHPHDWPTLNVWLHSINITDTEIQHDFFYSALVDYFPGAKKGSHLVPTEAEIAKKRPRLLKTIRDFKPEVVVPIGKLSTAYCLSQELLPLNKNIGRLFKADPYQALGYEVTVIPLPHPSGASTWRHKPENKLLLHRALDLLKSAI